MTIPLDLIHFELHHPHGATDTKCGLRINTHRTTPPHAILDPRDDSYHPNTQRVGAILVNDLLARGYIFCRDCFSETEEGLFLLLMLERHV